MRKSRKSPRLRTLFTLTNALSLLFLLLCAIVGWWFFSRSGLDLSSVEAFVVSIQSLGNLGILAYIVFLIVAIVIGPIPSTPMTVAAGLVWGPLPAALYGVVGLCLGSIAAYCIGRTLGRSAVKALMGKSIHLSNHRGEVYLGWIVFVAHLLPVLPYDLVSYGAGISGLSFPIFALANVLGLIPNTLLLTHLGAAFTIGWPVALLLAAVFLAMFVLLPWGVKRYNWLGLRDTIHLE